MDNKEIMNWLLEEENPSVRSFTLQEIVGLEENDTRLSKTRAEIMKRGAVPAILAQQSAEGWWDNAEEMSMPMYLSTTWQIILLAELGADGGDARIKKAIDLVFQRLQSEDGSFPHEGRRFCKKRPMDLICNDAMIAYGLVGVGVSTTDERMSRALEFLSRTLINGEYACRFNDGAQCAWGVVKALRVLASVPGDDRTELMKRAIHIGANYLFEHDLAEADFPFKENGKISEHWFRFGFPRSYQADLLQTARILCQMGYADDARLQPTIDFILNKRSPDGTWVLEDTWNKFSIPFVKKSKTRPSKWNTWQACYVLAKSGREKWSA
jgi:hypothetical protein